MRKGNRGRGATGKIPVLGRLKRCNHVCTPGIAQTTHEIVKVLGQPLIKSPFALLEIQMKILSRDAVVLSEMTFHLVPEVLNAIDMVLLVGE